MRPHADGRMVLCIPATDLPMMLARVALRIVCRVPIPTRCAHVPVFNVTAMRQAVVPILPALVGIRRTSGLLCASSVAAKPGWLLWEIATVVTASGTTAIASAKTIVGRVLLLSGGIDVGWGLLANIHAKLLDVS